MATLAENDRLTGPLLADAGQVDFDADFPLIDAPGDAPGSCVLVKRQRGAAQTTLVLGDFSVVAAASGGFTLRLTTPAAAGDQYFIVGRQKQARLRAHPAGGAVRTPTLEDDAREGAAKAQEQQRDLGRSLRLPVGSDAAELPVVVGDSILGFGPDKAPRYFPVADMVDGLVASFAGYRTLELAKFGAKCDGITDDGAAWEAAHGALSSASDVLNVIKWDGRSRCGRKIFATNVNVRYDGGEVLFTGDTGGIEIDETDNRIYGQRFVGSTAETVFLTSRVGLHTPIHVRFRFTPFAFKRQVQWLATSTVETMDIAQGQCWADGPRFRNLMTGVIQGDVINSHDAPHVSARSGYRLDGFCVGIKFMPGCISYVRRGLFVDPLRAWLVTFTGPGGFAADADVTGSTSLAKGVIIRQVGGAVFIADPSAAFTIGETITDETGASGVITGSSEYLTWVNEVGGAPTAAETWTGATSGASCLINAVGVDAETGGPWAQVLRTTTAEFIPGETLNRTGGGESATCVASGRRPYGGEGFYLSDTEFVGTEHSLHIDCRYAAKLFTGFEVEGWHSNASKGAAFFYSVLQPNFTGGILYPLTTAPGYAGIAAYDCDEISVMGATFANGSAGQTAIALRGRCTKPQITSCRATGAYGVGLERGPLVLAGVVVANDFGDCAVPRQELGALYPGANFAVYAANVGIPDTARPRGGQAFAANQAVPALNSEAYIHLTQNAVATTITGFTGALEGFTFELVGGDNNTTLAHSATLVLEGGIPVKLPNGGAMRFILRGGIWIELSRNFASPPLPWGALAVNAAVPAVDGLRRHYKTANTAPTVVTGFSGGGDGAEWKVLIDGGNTTFQHSASLILLGGVNVAPPDGRFMTFVRDGAVVRESGRNF